MRRTTILAAGLMLVVTACGSGGTGGDPGSSADDGASGSSGNVIDPPPPGQATVSVDGLELTFEEPGAVPCSIADGEFGFSFRIGDNEITIGAGGTRFDEVGWGGSIMLVVANPEGEPGPVTYVVFLRDIDESDVAFDGSSMSYSGPMLKQTPGSDPPGEEIGTGTISATCP